MTEMKEEDMAPEKKAAPAPAEQNQQGEAVPEPSPTGEVFPAERLIEDSTDLTGYQSHEVAGALAGQDKSEFTVDEARELTRAWLETPVEEPAASEEEGA